MNIHRIVPDFTATDFDACRNFYVDILGLKLAMDLGWIITFVSPSNPTAQLSMIQKDQTAPVTPQVTIEVEDVTTLFNSAKATGADIVYPLNDEVWGVRRFFVRDPNGIIVNIMGHQPVEM